MCLAIPGRVVEFADDEHHLAVVDVSGVRRRVNVDLLQDSPPVAGDWVLIHVGFAMSKISHENAAEQLRLLAMLGEDRVAMQELEGYRFGEPGDPENG
jgi:hydrogenase expression/formation protein HypC